MWKPKLVLLLLIGGVAIWVLRSGTTHETIPPPPIGDSGAVPHAMPKSIPVPESTVSDSLTRSVRVRLVDAADRTSLTDTAVAIVDLESGRRAALRTDSAGALALAPGRVTLESPEPRPRFHPVEVSITEDVRAIALTCIGYLHVHLTRDVSASPQCQLAIVPEHELQLGEPLPSADAIWERNSARAVSRAELVASSKHEIFLPLATAQPFVLLARHPDLHKVQPGHSAWVGSTTIDSDGMIQTTIASLSSPNVCPVSSPFELQPGEVRSVEIVLARLVPAKFYLDVARPTDWTVSLTWKELFKIGTLGNGQGWRRIKWVKGQLPPDATLVEAQVHPGAVRFFGTMVCGDECRLLNWEGEAGLEGCSISPRDALGPWRLGIHVELAAGESIEQWIVHESRMHGGDGYFVIRGLESPRVEFIGMRGPVGKVEVAVTGPQRRRTMTADYDVGERSVVRLR